jgi:hypothetical protein
MPVGIKNDFVHVYNVGTETFCERSLRLLLVCVDDLLMLFEALSNLSPVLLLEFLPFVEVCVIRRVWAFSHLGVLFFRFMCLVNLFFLLIHQLFFSMINDTHACKIFNIFHHLSFRGNREEMFHIFLFELIIISLDSLVKPIRVSDLWNWIHAFLKCSWNGYNLLD